VRPLTIPIEGVRNKSSVDAPDAFVLHNDIFSFTDGAAVYTYSLNQGFLYKVAFITPDTYDPETNTISDLALDAESMVLSIVVSKKTKVGGNEWKHSTELYFYSLAENGTITQLSHIAPEGFGDAAIAPGSSFAIGGTGILTDGKANGSAYFMASNGKLYQASWTGVSADVGKLTEIASLEEYTQPDSEFLSSVSTAYNKETRVFELLKSGGSVFIHRPLNTNGRGKIGSIHRPLNIRVNVDEPVLALLQVAAKKTKVLGQKIFFTELQGQGGVSNIISDEAGNRYVATYSGNLFGVNKGNEVEKSTLDFMGQIGNRLSGISYFASRNTIVGINALEAEGGSIVSPGGLSLAKRKDPNSYLSFVNWAEDTLSNTTVLGLSYGSIRRPCNSRPQ
jgi:hypothetical protein